MRQIGRYRVIHEGGHWQILYHDELLSLHASKWDAIRTARDLNWRDVHEKKRPPTNGGPEEPKSKWRRVI